MLLKEDKKPCETNSPLWAVNNWYITDLYSINHDWEFEFYDYSRDVAPAYVNTSASNTVISISGKTKYPEKAIKLLEKLHTDQRYYDLLVYGVIGEHYFLNENGIYFDGIMKETRFGGWTGAADEFLSYSDGDNVNRQWHDVYERELRLSAEKAEGAPISPYDGFSMNVIGMTQIVGNINEVKAKYFQPILCGITADLETDYNAALEMLRRSGIEEYLEEMEKQLQKLANN